jgi:hypothetical protein
MGKPRPATLEPDEFDGMITGGTGSDTGNRELYLRYHLSAPRLDLKFTLDRADVAFGAPGWPELLALHALYDELLREGDYRGGHAVRDALIRFREARAARTPTQVFEDEACFWAHVRKQTPDWRAGKQTDERGKPVHHVLLTADEREEAIRCAYANQRDPPDPDTDPPRSARRSGISTTRSASRSATARRSKRR